jgi:hypothetical protein
MRTQSGGLGREKLVSRAIIRIDAIKARLCICEFYQLSPKVTKSYKLLEIARKILYDEEAFIGTDL